MKNATPGLLSGSRKQELLHSLTLHVEAPCRVFRRHAQDSESFAGRHPLKPTKLNAQENTA